MDGPHFRGWEVNHVAQDPRHPKRIYAAVNSAWFGPHIHASENGGKTWKPSDDGFAIKSLPDTKLARAWPNTVSLPTIHRPNRRLPRRRPNITPPHSAVPCRVSTPRLALCVTSSCTWIVCCAYRVAR